MVNRIGGLASGMDIDSLVDKLMKAERAPLYKLQQQKTKFEWQRDAYRSINSKLKTFSDYTFDNMILSSNFLKKTSSIAGKNSDKLSINAGPGATGSLSIQAVKQLATNASTGVKDVQQTSHRYAKDDDELNLLGITDDITINITKKDADGNVTTTPEIITIEATDKISDLVAKLNDVGLTDTKYDAATGKLSIGGPNTTFSFADTAVEEKLINTSLFVEYQKDGNGQPINDDNKEQTVTGSTVLGQLGLGNGSLTLNVVQANGEMKKTTISYSNSDTIDTFIKNLNTSGAGVTALFSNGQMTITANNSGKSKDDISEIQVLMNTKEENGVVTEDNTGKVLMNKLGFISDPNQVTSNDTVDLTSASTRGQNAIYAINGLYMESNSNNAIVSGYEIKLNGTFNETAIVDKVVTPPTNLNDIVQVSSTTDINAMVDKIKEFVNKYNELIAGLNGQLKETRYRDFAPLTAEQRAEMSESEQKLWDEKAKSGLLRGDSIIRTGLNDMRLALGGRVNGLGDNVTDTLAEMGITTSKAYNDGGKLIIDDTKLRKALSEDPDRVINTLTQSGERNSTTGEDTRGLVRRVRDVITTFTSNIEQKAGRSTMTDNQYALGKSLISTDERITKLQTRLKDVESRYWRRFTEMEKAISKANQQTSMFMQFSGGY